MVRFKDTFDLSFGDERNAKVSHEPFFRKRLTMLEQFTVAQVGNMDD